MITRVLGILLKAYYYRFSKFRTKCVYPKFINFLITYQCASRCSMCGIWRRYRSHPEKLKDELTASDIHRFCSRNADFLKELKHIGITGGEAFLREDIVEIIKIIMQTLPFVAVGVQTTGLIESTKSKIDEILRFYPQFSLAVSLDGVQETHDKIRGITGAFNKAIDLIKFARERNIPVSSGMTISMHNYSEIEKVKDITDSMGCEFTCFLPEESDYFNNINVYNSLSDDAKVEVAKTFKAIFGHHYYMDCLSRLIESGEKRSLQCYSGYTSIVIDPYGNLKPCILKEDSFGNIKKNSLRDILSSHEASALRKKIKKCQCWCQCEVSASVLVDPWDVIDWFIFSCRYKKYFLKELKSKYSRLS